MTFLRKQQGYSLVELLVYIALFAALSIVLIQSLVTSFKVYAASQSYRRVQSEGELSMERIVREVRSASAVTTASSVFGTNPGVLVLSGIDSTGASRSVIFSIVNGQLQINENGTNSMLTSTKISISSLIFRNITTPYGSAIKIELTVNTTVGQGLTASFYDTVILRGK